jgi:2'-5' RNA ligase
LRLFVAVELAPGVIEALSSFAALLRQAASAAAPAARISWVEPAQLHVTVRFIGEVNETRADAIAAALQPGLLAPAFDMAVAGAGAFPPRGAPRVLWAGIEPAGAQMLAAVEQEVSERLDSCGLEREQHPYRPHVTIARVREAAGLRASALLDNVDAPDFGVTRVGAITLFQSRTSPRGATYTALCRTSLR